MGSSLQTNPNQRNTILGAAEGYDTSGTDDSSSKAIRSVASPAARGSCLGNLPDIGDLPEPTKSHEATQAQRSVPSSAGAGILGHPVLISGCRGLHARCGDHSSSINIACVYEEIEFPTCWESHRTQTAETSSAEAPRMEDNDVELYYHSHELEKISESDNNGGILMMRSSNITSKLEVGASGIDNYAADPLSQGQHASQNYPKPAPQHIPQIHVQAVTPPDSKLAPHVTQDAITTGRPSPAPAPIALITGNRLPQNVGLATPEYTLVSQFRTPSPTSIPPKFVHGEVREERGFTPKLESFTNWPGNPSLPSFTEEAKNRVQQKVGRAYTCHLGRNTSLDPGISESLLRMLIPSPVQLGRGLTNSGSVTIKNTDYPVAEPGILATRDPHAKAVVRDFYCPPENYIHEHFTKEALRRRWELSQSYTQWPKLKTPNRDGPVLPFNEMEENCGIFLRQRQVRG